MTAPEIKPCPFCWAEPVGFNLEIIRELFRDEFFVRCICGANGPKCSDKLRAIERWNEAQR